MSQFRPRFIKEQSKLSNFHFLFHFILICRYNKLLYVVEGFDFSKKPEDCFEVMVKGEAKKVSFHEYYYKRYGISIKYKD